MFCLSSCAHSVCLTAQWMCLNARLKFALENSHTHLCVITAALPSIGLQNRVTRRPALCWNTQHFSPLSCIPQIEMSSRILIGKKELTQTWTCHSGAPVCEWRAESAKVRGKDRTSVPNYTNERSMLQWAEVRTKRRRRKKKQKKKTKETGASRDRESQPAQSSVCTRL